MFSGRFGGGGYLQEGESALRRRPLVRFETSEKATIVSSTSPQRGEKPRNKKRGVKFEEDSSDIDSDISVARQGKRKRREPSSKGTHPRQVQIKITPMGSSKKIKRRNSSTKMVPLKSVESRVKNRHRKKRGAGGGKGTKKPRMVKGRLQIRVAGYTGVQKIPPSTLIPYLPAVKLRAAAKKMLSQSGAVSKARGKKRKKGTRKKKTAKKKSKKR